ncbi:DMT family transporter [Oricola thermophila]|uniref:DMT family transporter n=1 Tax=Oricola thermophila TaxID=2742145 RepID=A0A6N1VE61_9HYPH|nr:DMT family transporter [Oricola thermophila]QKV17502.1 DMT family transporter [Oricola thermophila]
MTFPNAPIASTEPPRTSRTGLGIGLMLLGFMFFSITDATAKILTRDFEPFQIAWFRQLGLLTIATWIVATRGRSVFRTARPVLQIGRGMAAALSASAFIFAVGYVPLADATAVSFVAPFVVTILAAVVLRETVGIRRWTAVTIGFIGTLIVIRPGLGLFHPAIFVVLAAASLFAVRQILSRVLGPVDRTITTIVYTAISSVVLLTIPTILVWQTPTSLRQVLLILLIACTAGIGEFLIIRALELAQAATLAPLQYTMIIWSTGLSWLLFSQLPDAWSLIGAAIIMVSGIYTLHRERLAARQRRQANGA